MRDSFGLNPFFIRSIVQCRLGLCVGRRTGVLIPSSSGQSFNANLNRANLAGAVLIPSSSGQSFNASLFGANLARAGLNPFFIRSIVQWDTRYPSRDHTVLIPSSSGQSFNPRRRRTAPIFSVLIPSSSGQSFNLKGGEYDNGRES